MSEETQICADYAWTFFENMYYFFPYAAVSSLALKRKKMGTKLEGDSSAFMKLYGRSKY